MIKYSGLIVMLLFGLGMGFWLGQKQPTQNPSITATTKRKLLYYRHPMNPKVTSPTPAKDDMGMDYLPVYVEYQSQPKEQSQPGKVLYYRHPMGAPDTSPIPKKDEMGMDYLPVYEEDQSQAQPQQGKILYYRHPMGAPDTSPVPKKDEMGMDYLPVYESEPASTGQIQISPEKIQKLGVTTETVTKRTLTRSVRALGSIQIDERSVHAVSPKFEGWIQRLYANATGQAVKRGQPLLEVYSPELITAQQEYLIARQGQQALQQSDGQARDTASHLVENALRRLHYWDIAPAYLQRLQTQETPLETLPLLSPVNGVVLEKPAVEGLRFMPGDTLFRIADLSTVWLLADVFEQDIGGVRIGQAVQAHITAYPDRLFSGKVGFIYPTLTTETRTVKVRVELPNAEGLLKPGLYGNVTLATQADQNAHLAVPDSAVIASGARQIVLLQRGEGQFEPRAVKLGRQADGYWEVLEGLDAGHEVVTRANFLIDAESNLKSALSSFESQGANADQVAPETQHGDH